MTGGHRREDGSKATASGSLLPNGAAASVSCWAVATCEEKRHVVFSCCAANCGRARRQLPAVSREDAVKISVRPKITGAAVAGCRIVAPPPLLVLSAESRAACCCLMLLTMILAVEAGRRLQKAAAASTAPKGGIFSAAPAAAAATTDIANSSMQFIYPAATE